MQSIKEAAEKLDITERRLRTLCAGGRVKGAKLVSGVWVLPATIKIEAGKRGPQLTFNEKKEQGNGVSK